MQQVKMRGDTANTYTGVNTSGPTMRAREDARPPRANVRPRFFFPACLHANTGIRNQASGQRRDDTHNARKLGMAGVTSAMPFTMTANTNILMASDICQTVVR